MKSAALLIAFVATANAQCSEANFGLKILAGEPVGENDVFTDLPAACDVDDTALGRQYSCRLFRQVSRNRCLDEGDDIPVTVDMTWEVKNTKGGSKKLNLARTWVDFSGPAVEEGSMRVNDPSLDREVAEGQDSIWIAGGESVFFSATATVNKCEPSFDAKLRIEEVAAEDVTCVKRFVTKDLILRRCPLQNAVKCFVKNPNTEGLFVECDDIMRGIQDAPAEEKEALFRDNFCRQATRVKYEYELCSSSKNLTFEHKTKGDKKTRAFLSYDLGEGQSEQMEIQATYDTLEAEECKLFTTTVPAIDCSETADPSQFPVGIYDVNGDMKGANQQKIDRTYTGCWERTSYTFPPLDLQQDSATKEPCTEAPTAAPVVNTNPGSTAPNDMIQFTVPATFKKSKKCGKGGKGKKAPAPATRRH